MRLRLPTLSRLFATWLVVLIVLPFTAPWGTCDLSDLSDPGKTHSSSEGLAKTSASPDQTLVPPLLSCPLPLARVLTPLPSFALGSRPAVASAMHAVLRI